MKIFSLPWVTHKQGKEDVAIQSICLSSCGTRFATGGLDSNVKVWSFRKLFDSQEDPRLSAAPGLLATIGRHSSAVHSVRFSFFGKYLASGGADGRVIIYHLLAGDGGIPLGSKTKNHENWGVFRVFQQALDISEVAWGPESRRTLLASASFDTAVNVYDVEANSLLFCLKGHSHMVKGLCWDPLGEFLASQAEQEGVYIWDLSTGACLSKINKHLTHSTKSFDQSRLDWGPTGRFIAAAVGFDNPCYVVPFFARGKWDGNQSLVGHQALVTVAKYNPRLFYNNGGKVAGEENPGRVSECIALGSADATFSIWLNHMEVPILRGKRFCNAGITDLAWSNDGYTLLCSSLDGRAFGVNFLESELGTGVSQEMNEELTYGAGESTRALRKKLPVAESAEQLAMEKASKEQEQSKSELSQIQPMSCSKVEEAAVDRMMQPDTVAARLPQEMPKQIPQVTPLLTSSIFDAPSIGHKSAAETVSTTDKGDSQEKSERMVENKILDHTPPSNSERVEGNQTNSNQGATVACETNSNTKASKEAREEKPPAPSKRGLPAADDERTTVELTLEASNISRMPSEEQSLMGTRKRMRLENRVQNAPGALQNEVQLSVQTDKGNRGAIGLQPKQSDRKKGTIVCQKELNAHLGEDGNGQCIRLEVINELSGAKISMSRGKKVAWRAAVKGTVINAGGNANFVAISTKEGFVLVYDNLGRCLLHYVKLSAPVLVFKTDSNFLLLALLSDGHVWTWDVCTMQCGIEATVDLLGGPSQVSSMSISRSGRPVAILKSRDAYVFNPHLKQWVLLADSSRPYPGYLTKLARECGELWGDAIHQHPPMSAGISSRPPSATTNPVLHLDYLEANMCAARSLDSADDFLHWSKIYLKTLVSTAGNPQAKGTEESKLRKVCMELLELGDGTCSDFLWAVEKLALDKRRWVESDILVEVGKNRDLQRFREELEGLLEDSKI